ncbi:hypothetical protein bcere0030_20380 [Bacillus cereus AH1273]|nr:hypothetical protein bcere0030_20380 [Bacillus cereus AH1273]
MLKQVLVFIFLVKLCGVFMNKYFGFITAIEIEEKYNSIFFFNLFSFTNYD